MQWRRAFRRTWLSQTRVYVVNLRRRTDRLAHMKDQFASAGIRRYEVIRAIDARVYDIRTERTVSYLRCPGNERGVIDPGWVAHHMTMASTFDWLARQRFRGFTMLLEDDCVFMDGFRAEFERVCDSLPDGWGCLLSGTRDNRPDLARPVNEHLWIPGYPILRHFMYLTPLAISVLAEVLGAFEETYDNQTGRLFTGPCGFAVYSTTKPLVTQTMHLGTDGVSVSKALDDHD